MVCAVRSSTTARFSPERSDQRPLSNAAFAEATAALTSSGVATRYRPTTWPLAGFSRANASPSPLTQRPSIQCAKSLATGSSTLPERICDVACVITFPLSSCTSGTRPPVQPGRTASPVHKTARIDPPPRSITAIADRTRYGRYPAAGSCSCSRSSSKWCQGIHQFYPLWKRRYARATAPWSA